MGLGMLGGMALFWLILIAFAVFVVRMFFPSVSSGDNSDTHTPLSAREVLDQRYARGELTREQYQQMQKDLRE